MKRIIYLIFFSLQVSFGYSQTEQDLTYATYFGGNGADFVNRIDRSVNGNIYLAGKTNSSVNISSIDSYQENLAGTVDGYYFYDGFLSCFDEDYQLQWSTYFGGDTVDFINGLATLPDNSAVITGGTFSNTGIITEGCHQENYGGEGDVFLSRFSADGNLLWSTYFGGSNYDFAESVAVDDFDNIYIAGFMSSDSLGTEGVHQEYIGNGSVWDAFVAKFDNNGVLIWCTYYGGSGDEKILDIDINSYGEVCLLGYTSSDDSIATEGAHQDFLAGDYDNFIAIIDSSGNRVWGSYYGGTGYEMPSRLDVDDYNNIIVCGRSSSLSGIATEGVHKEIPEFSDLFLASFNYDGSINWGTFFGGSEFDGQDCEVFINDGDILFTGGTYSENGISMENAFQYENSNSVEDEDIDDLKSDAFLVKFNSFGEQEWGTYYGAITGSEYGRSITVLDNNIILIAGITSSSEGIVTEDAYQYLKGSSYDGFFAEFDIDISVGINEYKYDEITLYPNPTRNYFSLSTNDESTRKGSLDIFTIDGRKLLHLDNYTCGNEINLNLPTGVYLIKYISEGLIYSNKLIIKE